MAAQNSASVLVSGAQAGGNGTTLYVMAKESGLATCLMPYPYQSSGLTLDDTHIYVGAHVPQGEGPTSNGWIDAIPLAGGATTTLVQLPSMHASSLLVASGFVWFVGNGHLWRVPSAGGTAEDLGPASGAPFAATDTRIFANDDSAVFALDIATTTWEQVATIGGGAQLVRHRDGWIYWSTHPTASVPSKLHRVPDTGGVPTPLIDLTNFGFDVVGNAVFYFQVATCPENTVHRYDVGTGSELEWFTAPCYASVLADSTAPRLFAVSSWDSNTPGTLSRVDAN